MMKRLLLAALLCLPLLADAQVRQLLDAEPDRSRWPAIKSQEIERLVTSLPRETRAGGLEIEITRTRDAGNGVLEIFVRAWQDGQQIGFGADGSVDVERMRIVNPPILVPDPAGPIVRILQLRNGTSIELRHREDLRETLLQVIETTIAVKQEKVIGSRRIVGGRIGRTTLTAFPNAGTGTAPIDGFPFRTSVNETFTTIRAAAGSDHNDTGVTLEPHLISSAGPPTGRFATLGRAGVGFDTSSIGADTISSATMSFTCAPITNEFGAHEVGVTSFTPGNGADFANSDFNIANYGSTEFISRFADGSWVTDQSTYNDMPLNASGITHINTSGNTFFAVRLGWDIDNSFDGTWTNPGEHNITMLSADIDGGGTTRDPKLVVEHAAAGGDPVVPAHVISH